MDSFSIPYRFPPVKVFPSVIRVYCSHWKGRDFMEAASRYEKEDVSCIFLLLGWPVYFALYYLTETRIPRERCIPMHLWVDDLIPFCEWFVIPYVLWYFWIVFSLAFFLFRDPGSFRRLQTYFILLQVAAIAVCILLPNRQDLRPEVFPRDNVLSRCVGLLYRVDTSTGVCPSLHVALSVAMASVWRKAPGVARGWKVFFAVSAVLVSLSTLLIKQHSAVDVLAALLLCRAAERLLYRGSKL